MKKLLINTFIAIGILTACSATLSSNYVYAGPFDASKSEACDGANLGSGGTCDKQTSEKKINDLVATVINILSVIVGIIAVIMIIINGLRFVTSNGDSNSVSSAKNGIIYALVGLVLVAFAQMLVRFVIESTK